LLYTIVKVRGLLPLHFAPPLVELASNSNLLLQQQTTPKKTKLWLLTSMDIFDNSMSSEWGQLQECKSFVIAPLKFIEHLNILDFEFL
jgi:hypothetical protein